VARTASLSISAETDNGDAVEVDASAIQQVSGVGKLSIERSAASELKYTGAHPLAFGVELHELGYDARSHALILSVPGRPVRVRGSSDAADVSSDIDSMRPAFIGGMDGEVLLHAYE
jgi:hypothetical protein